MSPSNGLNSPDAIAAWLSGHLTKGEGMRRPYYRKWENGGCSPKHSLRSWRSDCVAILADGLASLGRPIFGSENGVIVQMLGSGARVSADLSLRDRPPREFVIQVLDGPGNYVGDSPEVIVELLRGLASTAPPLVEVDIIDVGFPGHEQDEFTYVGSWQWGVHGEAQGAEFVARAAAATLAVIEAAESERSSQ
ncbi:hypothetical protein FHT40_002161 [Mycolicibacterium sp. BK556]|uniref:hypothetical protein n=1 Tax=Mycobacteriaceae TaxID=1762 RepID=UPI0010600942|nr:MULTISPECIES: hypothetical protein [Mycobacteriaceae]MBB3602528.1 hypothetical protein [Mycolicibacterium sp. BK556]MBB3632280.1 hypothetical protein [Mycolicibacterium sp. BK607]MBB3750301.1 hypothetical protein [Mycolicibacterium sp. BK634]TDO18429.1 hypothetical protein EV580_1616 [Mycobacterium sp. BK086]